MENQKKEIRKRYKKMREAMTAEQVAAWSRKICAQILSSAEFREADWIFAYYPLGNEADVREVIRAAWRKGKRVAFPKVFGEEMRFFEVREFSELHPGTFGVMEPEGGAADADELFGEYREAGGQDFVAVSSEKKSGMPCEGAGSQSTWKEQKPWHVLMLVPGVAFDWAGSRMGYGKGYYDQYLAAWRDVSENGNCISQNMDSVSADAPQRGQDFGGKKRACFLRTMGVAYRMQVAGQIPTEDTDVPLDYLVTEEELRECSFKE